MTTYIDDRTTDQHATHRLAVIGTDSFMSGWGGAEGGASYAGWAFQDGNYAACLELGKGPLGYETSQVSNPRRISA